MTITRRELLRRAGLLGVASLIPSFTACKPGEGGDDEVGDDTDTGTTDDTGNDTGTETGGDGLPTYEWEGEPGPETLFSHGVASGDPLTDSVILWTRVSPAADEPVELFFEAALDPQFEMRVAADWIGEATNERDYTIKIDLDGLEPGTTYYYRFYAQGRVSPVGRTRTAPVGPSERLRFAVVSCASYAHGYFHVYGEVAGRADLAAVIHLGDYIYEFADGEYGDVRSYDPVHEIVTLDDYYRRYRQYRTDPDLQEAHRQHPFIITWDDHEIANDGWSDGAENHDDSDGEWVDRRAAATKVFFEWLPIREGVEGRVYRDLSYGDLIHIIVLDTRYEGRDEQVPLTDPDALAQIYAEGRQMLGAEQEAWCFERLSSSSAQWKLLAQQVMIGQLIITPGENGEPNRPFFNDPWDGYDHARRRLLEHIRDSSISDVIVVTGDFHSSFVNELTIDPWVGYDPQTGEGVIAAEFLTPSVTSPGLGFDDGTIALLQSRNPHIRWMDVLQKGYMVLDVDTSRVQVDYFHFGGGQIGSPNFVGSTYASSWRVDSGSPRISETQGPAAELPEAPPLAP